MDGDMPVSGGRRSTSLWRAGLLQMLLSTIGERIMDENEPMAPAARKQSALAKLANPIAVLPHLAGDRDACVSVLPDVTMEDRQRALIVRSGQHFLLDNLVNMDIEVYAWLVTIGEFPDDETGEVSLKPLTRVVLADGSIRQTTGPAVYRMLRDYHCTVRQAPWEPPAKFRVRRIPTRKDPNKSYYALEPIFAAGDDEAPAARKERKK